MSTRLTITFNDAQETALEEIAHQNRTSKSEIVRNCVDEVLTESDTYDVPEWARVPVARERVKTEGKLNYLRATFRQRVYDQHENLLKKGLSAEEIRMVKANYLSEAQELWPGEEYDEMREDRLDYVQRVNEAAQEANDVSDFGRLDPENFNKFSGVEEGRSRQQAEEYDIDSLTQFAKAHLETRPEVEQVDLIKTVQNRKNVPEGPAKVAVENAFEAKAENEIQGPHQIAEQRAKQLAGQGVKHYKIQRRLMKEVNGLTRKEAARIAEEAVENGGVGA